MLPKAGFLNRLFGSVSFPVFTLVPRVADLSPPRSPKLVKI